MLPRETLKFTFSKMHIWRILGENSRKNGPKLTMKMVCVEQQINNYHILSALVEYRYRNLSLFSY